MKRYIDPARVDGYRRTFARQCASGLSPFKNSWTLLSSKGKNATGSRQAWRKRKKAGKKAKHFANDMRQNPTPAEAHCREVLVQLGFEHEWQKVFTFPTRPQVRITDFFLPAQFIAIEVDGGYHFTEKGKIGDQTREAQFKDEYPQIQFLRYTNTEVMASDFADKIKRQVESLVNEPA